ncbi:PP2C family protein-serine/threonine phosphatase [Arthrobacter monumenti]
MAAGMDENEQRRLFKEAVERAGLQMEELWMRYFSLGGGAGQFEVEAYIHGANALPALQRDLLSQALNEYLRESSSSARAPYSRPVSEPLPDHGPLAALVHLLSGMQISPPERLPAVAAAAGKDMGVDLTIYLADDGQRHLVPLLDGADGGAGNETPSRGNGARHGSADGAGLEVDGSMPGRAFQELKVVASHEDGRLWVPLVNGSERLGVVEVALGDNQDTAGLHDPGMREQVLWLSGLIARLAAASNRSGDALRTLAHQTPTSTDAQLIHHLLPAHSAATDCLVVAGALDPVPDARGGIFDYSLSETTAHLAIFGMYDDGSGSAGAGSPAMLAAVAVSAYRAARRNGDDLVDQGAGIDEALAIRFGPGNHVSGILAEVDLTNGRLLYLTAGHPPPVVVPQAGVSQVLMGGRRLPFGRPDSVVKSHAPVPPPTGPDLDSVPATGFSRAPGEHRLRPWDWLALFSDGVTGARGPAGTEYGLTRFVNGLREQMSLGSHPSEAARVVLAEVAHHRGDTTAGDAVVVLARWAEAGPPVTH